MQKFVVIAGPSSKKLAEKISKKIEGKLLKSNVRRFPDGESKITIKGITEAEKVIVVQSTPIPVDTNLFHLFSLIYQARKFSSNVYAVIPYLGYAKQDKEFLKGEIVSISVIANLFKELGVSKLIVVDLHSIEGLQFFRMPSKNLTAVPALAHYFQNLKLDNPLVVSPDLFWKTRAEEFAKILGCKAIALHKYRDRKTGKLVIKSTKPNITNLPDLILLDDMVSTGGSVIKAIEFLQRKNFGKIYVACTHAVLAGDAKKRLEKSGVNRIVSTDSIYGKTAKVDISDMIVESIKNWD